MTFTETSLKHRKYQTLLQIIVCLIAIYDLRNGHLLKDAFGGMHATAVFIWIITLFGLLGIVAMAAMLGPFYRAGGKVWTQGGREQFAHAGGFTVSFYGTLAIEALAILAYPHVREHTGWVLINNGITITIISSLISALFCRLSAMIIFKRPIRR